MSLARVVQQIENGGLNSKAGCQAIPCLRSQQCGRHGPDAVVLDQRIGAEMADAKGPKRPHRQAPGHSSRDHVLYGAGNPVLARGDVPEPGPRQRYVEIERQARERPMEVGEGDAQTPARRGGLSEPGVAHEQQLAVEGQSPD